MSCATCKQVCSIYSCYSNLWIGKTTVLAGVVSVTIKNVGTGRVVTEDVTTSIDGLVKISGGTWNKMLFTEAQIEIKIMQDGDVVTVFPYLDPNASPATFSTTAQDCLVFNTSPVYGSDGDMYAYANQYLIEP
jgi:hypothetical protein